MNNPTVAFLWCVLQVTLVSAFALVWYALLRRTSPASRAVAAFTALVLILALTAGACSPWPRWSFAARPESTAHGVAASPPPREETAAAPSDEPADLRAAHGTAMDEAASADPTAAALVWDALTTDLQRPAAIRSEGGWRWPDILVAIAAAGAAVGVARLIAGLAFVRRYRAGSRPITDSQWLELRDILQAELSCPGRIELLESDRLSTAATIGWRRPIILLPANRCEWNDDERRAVLAHEIAHIQRHDFATWVAAQGALALHFYHPLVHWLCGRLRLEQELAADAAAARFAGGQQAYLTTLAAMALRQADRPLAWPARTFLPTRGTFMRRIEMLRDAKLGPANRSAGLRVGTVVVLLAAGLFVAGFRGMSGPADAADGGSIPGAVAGAATGAANEPASLAYVPRDAVMLAMVRPAKLLRQPEFAQLVTAVERLGFSGGEAETLKRVEQVSLVFLMRDAPRGPMAPSLDGYILRMADAADAQQLAKKLVPNAVEEEYGSHKFFKNRDSHPNERCYFLVDEKTLVVASEETGLRRMIVAGSVGASKAKWAAAWNEAAGSDGAFLVNVGPLTAEWDKALRNSTSPNGPLPLLSSFAPLWQNTDVITVSLKSEESLMLLARLLCGSADDAKTVQETAAAVVTLARNSLSQARAAAARLPGKEGPGLLGAADIAESFLDTIKMERKDERIEIAATVPSKEVALAAALLVPAVSNARASARAAQSQNNLKQIGLAMHNYVDTYGKFPPAVLYGPDGKTAYSWRVALLPFLERARLYHRYRFNEPWDSENNRKILAEMPPVFRDPNEPDTLMHSSYFALTGPDTVFSGKEGTAIHEIADGTSNTILVVEAKRDIPWTKPEDIPYAADKPLPKLGGHHPDSFVALLCDGSVHGISNRLEEKVLRVLITKQGGEPVPDWRSERRR